MSCLVITDYCQAAFLGLSVDEYEEMLAPPVYMCTIEHVPFRTRPELEAFRTDGTAANEGEFLQQQEAKEVVTGVWNPDLVADLNLDLLARRRF